MFKLEDRPIDHAEPLTVIVVGAGISGITAGILLNQKVPGIELTILERHEDVGGVWHVNQYPGVRCDVPSDVYQSTFAPSMTWSENYASGPEIKAYWKSLVEKHDLQRLIHCNSTVASATWSEQSASWELLVHDSLDDSKQKIYHAQHIILATGLFSIPKMPDVPGLVEFQGHLRHSADWDPSFDPTNKRIAVIGNGASGLQIVPALQELASVLNHYARNGAWIVKSYVGEDLDRAKRQMPPEDAAGYLQYRKELESKFFKTFGAVRKVEDRNAELTQKVTDYMRTELQARPDLFEKIIPAFPLGCRQSTPAPLYMQAVQASNVNILTLPIKSVTMSGIEMTDGSHREYDAIICCSGWSLDRFPSFPVIVDGANLQDSWSKGGIPGFINTYLGMAAPKVPNFFLLLGPNSAGLAGTVPNAIENQVTYIAKILRKVSMQKIRTIMPSQAATDDFRQYCDSFFPTTVLSEECRSWYKGGEPKGRIRGLWPGSATHANLARRDVRFEDYEYTYCAETGNRFAWLGNGCTIRDLKTASDETSVGTDYTPYLKEEAFFGNVDLRAIHELWYDV